MKKKKVKHTIYSLWWMLIWMISAGWAQDMLMIFINGCNINVLTLCVVLLTSVWIGVQRFVENLLKVMAYRAIEKKGGNSNGQQL